MVWAAYFFLWALFGLGSKLGIFRGRRFRLLAPISRLAPMSRGVRPQRINALLKVVARRPSYLVIGTSYGHTLQAVRARKRVGVDPNCRFNYKITPPRIKVHNVESDTFFRHNSEKFDFIFLDGLHEAHQTYRDLMNALEVLRDGGLILIDDVRPDDFASSLPNEHESGELKDKLGITHSRWFGDVYKVIDVILRYHPELGVGIFGNTPGKHGQALVWRRPEGHPHKHADIPDLDSITFESVFGQGPGAFWVEDLSLSEPGIAARTSPYSEKA